VLRLALRSSPPNALFLPVVFLLFSSPPLSLVWFCPYLRSLVICQLWGDSVSTTLPGTLHASPLESAAGAASFFSKGYTSVPDARCQTRPPPSTSGGFCFPPLARAYAEPLKNHIPDSRLGSLTHPPRRYALGAVKLSLRRSDFFLARPLSPDWRSPPSFRPEAPEFRSLKTRLD